MIRIGFEAISEWTYSVTCSMVSGTPFLALNRAISPASTQAAVIAPESTRRLHLLSEDRNFRNILPSRLSMRSYMVSTERPFTNRSAL